MKIEEHVKQWIEYLKNTKSSVVTPKRIDETEFAKEKQYIDKLNQRMKTTPVDFFSRFEKISTEKLIELLINKFEDLKNTIHSQKMEIEELKRKNCSLATDVTMLRNKLKEKN